MKTILFIFMCTPEGCIYDTPFMFSTYQNCIDTAQRLRPVTDDGVRFVCLGDA